MLSDDIAVLDRTTLRQVEQILDAHTRERAPVTRWTAFSWSASRHQLFEQCKRKYYLHYYGARRVREANNKVVSAVWWYKKLGSHQAWIGTVIHEIAARIMRAYREGTTPDEDAWVQQAIAHYEDGLRASTRQRRMGREWVLLEEHIYRDEPFTANSQRVADLMHTFFASEAYDFIGEQPPQHIIEVDEPFQTFELPTVTPLDTVPVYAIPDVALYDGATYHIVDWKTGDVTKETIQDQMGIYRLYMNTRYDTEDIITHVADLGGDGATLQTPPPTLEESHQFVQESVQKMVDHMVDVEYHTVTIQDYPMTDDLSQCQTCNFRRVCWRHG